MRLLLIEDDEKIAGFITKGMNEAGFVVEHAANGNHGLAMALNQTFDVAIIDIMLPGITGLQVIDELRNRRVTLPVLILSAKREVSDRVRGIESGGDDYLIKPFAFSELLARVQGLIRRATNMAEPTTLKVHDLAVNLLARTVTRGNKPIDLQPREFNLLEYLMRNAGRVVSKSMIIEHVWDYNFDPHTNVVEARICKLRDKIDKQFAECLIHTVRGVGYVLREPRHD